MAQPSIKAAALAALVALSACTTGQPFDFDLRGDLGGSGLDTSGAAQGTVTSRPDADARGLISYPSYQVALARPGDTVADVAARLGLPASELAAYNGLPPDVPLRNGELIALPRRVAEPAGGPIQPTDSGIDIAALAENAIDRSQTSDTAPVSGAEPDRHKVVRGETAYSISRLYGVPVAALAEWNGLDHNYTVRDGQYLLIPVVMAQGTASDSPSLPGQGSPSPTPPSAAQPLPAVDESVTVTEVPEQPDLSSQTTAASASDAPMIYPVPGNIVRAYAKGRNEGIDIETEPGTPVKAADNGTVAAITRDTDQVPILVLRHAGNVLTVYAGVDRVSVTKGESVTRGQVIAQVRDADPAILHFEVREGFDSVDPMPYLE